MVAIYICLPIIYMHSFHFIDSQVGFINFSSWYEDYENPLRIDVDVPGTGIFSVTTPHDIFTCGGLLSYKLPLVNY